MKAAQILLGIGVLFLFACPAHADGGAGTLQWQFTMTNGFIGSVPDPAFFGSGILTTTTLQPACPSDTMPHYTVLNISGTFNGFAMSQPNGAGVCGDDLVQLGPSLEPPPQESIVLFDAGGVEWGIEFNDLGIGPKPQEVFPINGSGVPTEFFDLTVTPIATPEPASVTLLAAGFVFLLRRQRKSAQNF